MNTTKNKKSVEEYMEEIVSFISHNPCEMSD
jgi:hypothetical protein